MLRIESHYSTKLFSAVLYMTVSCLSLISCKRVNVEGFCYRVNTQEHYICRSSTFPKDLESKGSNRISIIPSSIRSSSSYRSKQEMVEYRNGDSMHSVMAAAPTRVVFSKLPFICSGSPYSS